MKVRYTGPHTEVEIAATGDVVERGHSVEVPDDVGESLLEQDTWKKAADKAADKKEAE